MIIFVVAIGLLISIASYQKYKKWINPYTVYVIPHSASMVLLLGSNFLDSSLSENTLISFFGAELIYCLGVFLSGRFTLKNGDRKVKRATFNIYWFVGITSVIVDIFIALYIRAIQSSFGIINAYLNLSGYNAFIQTEGVNSFYSIMVFLSTPLSLLIQVCLRRLPDIKEKPIVRVLLIIQFFICFVPFISARRSVLFLTILMNLMLYYLMSSHEKRHNYKRIIIIVASVYLGLLFFSKTQSLMNKTMDLSITCFGIIVPQFLRDAFGYFAGNYAYLNKAIENGVSMGTVPLLATLRVAYIYLGGVFGLNVDTTSPFALSFLQIGKNYSYTFNTTPIHYYFMVDLGPAYLLGFWVLGLITGSIFYRANRKQTYWSYMLCAFQYSLVFMSFREYNLIFVNSIIILLFIWVFKQFNYRTSQQQEVEGL